jgi:hypothetical protein
MNTTQRAHRAAIQPIPAILGSIVRGNGWPWRWSSPRARGRR